MQVVGDGGLLAVVAHVGVDDLPQGGGAVVEGGLGGAPVVGDVLVDARDRQVPVPLGGAHGDGRAHLGARRPGLVVGQGDLVLSGGGASGHVLHGEGAVVADVDEHRLPVSALRAHLVAAAQHGGVLGDAVVGGQGALHGGQVLGAGAHVDAQVRLAHAQVGGDTGVVQGGGDVDRQHHGEGAQRQDAEQQGVGGAQRLAHPEPLLDGHAPGGGQAPPVAAPAQGAAGPGPQGLDGGDRLHAPQGGPGEADNGSGQPHHHDDGQAHAPDGGGGRAQVEQGRGSER